MEREIQNIFSLSGKTVVLTGAAGIFGRGIARVLARSGARLVVGSRNLTSLEALAEEIIKDGGLAECHLLNLEDPDSIEEFCAFLHAQRQPIHGLVNNAVLRPMKDLRDPLEDFTRSLHVNATGVFDLTRRVADSMRPHMSGSIVTVGSIQGMIGPYPSLYSGTGMTQPPDYFFHKGGWINLTRYFASVYGKDGIRVNCVSPGGCFGGQDSRFVERYCEKTMLGRMANPEDLGGPVTFLLSDAACYVTGVNLPVDAGYTAK